MDFQDGGSGFFPDFDFNAVLQGGLGQKLLNIGTQALSGYVGQQFAAQPASYQANMAVVPAAARAVATVGRGFFQKFPNLATSIQKLRNMGKNVTRAKLYSALKRFGPEMLVVCEGASGRRAEWVLSAILPHAFGPSNLPA